MSTIRSVAILGGGPAGAALGTHLVRAGVRVVIFEPGRRPELVVGESLVPALIPLLQKLGIEEDVAKVSTFKPGATFYATAQQEVSFFFKNAGGTSPRYAYNVPRDAFDSIVAANARKAGVVFVQRRAGIIADPDSDMVAFDEETCAIWKQHTGLESPELIVDATGRRRTIANLLNLGGWEGDRKDVAVFSHVPDAETSHEGHIHINRLRHGWAWRIPLPGRVSVGVVIPQEALCAYGATAEEQYSRLLSEEPILRSYIRDTTRIKPVMKYSNYQMCSNRWTGKTWALVGDAGGFIDPIFSSGLLLALEGASELAQAILSGWDAGAKRYEKTMHRKMTAWRTLIQSFYDGRFFSLFRLRSIYGSRTLLRPITKLVDQQLALALSGVAPTSKRRLWLLTFLLHRLKRAKVPSRFRIA
jgi:flavin-dependent dehydrogenase